MTYRDTDRVHIDDRTIRQLFETLIWQACDADGEPLDHRGYTRSDISSDSQAAYLEQFRSFLTVCWDDVLTYREHTGADWEQVAHDYVLTSHRHGTGFWDRCYCANPHAAAARLTDAAHTDGSADLSLGDDGFLHIA